MAAADRAPNADNDAERERLEDLVARLSAADLERPLGGGWMVATTQSSLLMSSNWACRTRKRARWPFGIRAGTTAVEGPRAACRALGPVAAASRRDSADALFPLTSGSLKFLPAPWRHS